MGWVDRLLLWGSGRGQSFGVVGLSVVVASVATVGVVRSETVPARQFDLGSGSVWLAASALGGVVLLDGTTPGSTPTSVQVIGSPDDGLLVHQIGSDALVVNERTGGVSRIDGARQQATDPVSFFGPDRESSPVGLAVEPEGVWAYATDPGAARAVDPFTLSALDEPVPLPGPAGSAAVDTDGSLWLTNDTDGVAYRVGRGETDPAVVPVGSDPGDRLTVRRVGGDLVLLDHQRGRIAGAGTGGVGDWSNCPGLTATSVVGRAGADATVLPIANNGSGTVTLFDPGTGSCRDTGTIGDQNSEYGTAVETGGDVFIPDLATRRVLIVRADTGALVATTDPLDTPGPFELQTAGGLVFYNDPDSPAAGRVEIQGVISQPKYTDGTTGIAVQGTQTTPDPPDEPPDEIDQPLDEWSCSTQQTQAVAGTPVTFEVLGPTAVQTVAWEFSNGTTGQGNPIETTFTTTGTITGTATITTDTGTQTTSCNTITVVNNETELELVARFTISNAKPVAGNPVTFTNKSEGNPTTWAWTFQDGTPATSNQRKPHRGVQHRRPTHRHPHHHQRHQPRHRHPHHHRQTRHR